MKITKNKIIIAVIALILIIAIVVLIIVAKKNSNTTKLKGDTNYKLDFTDKFVEDEYQKVTVTNISVADNFFFIKYDVDLTEKGIAIDKVINLHVPDEEIMGRALNRRTCENPECKEIYNMRDNPPKVEGICDKCGSKLFIRDDDNEVTVTKRLTTYHNQTEPLIAYYT